LKDLLRTLNREISSNQAAPAEISVVSRQPFPISVDEITNVIREECDQQTAFRLISTAVGMITKYLGLSPFTERLEVFWSHVQTARLPLGPHGNIISVEYQDADGDFHPFTGYKIRGNKIKEFTVTEMDISNYSGQTSIRIVYDSGFSEASPQFQIIKSVALELIGDLYFNPGSFSKDGVNKLPLTYQMKLQSVKL
jgi:hypothetical protein